jgi:hypothetical protein
MSDVRDFGASGDGKQDDTEAIRHAVRDGDGVLYFPRGEYRITAPIEIELNATGHSCWRCVPQSVPARPTRCQEKIVSRVRRRL